MNHLHQHLSFNLAARAEAPAVPEAAPAVPEAPEAPEAAVAAEPSAPPARGHGECGEAKITFINREQWYLRVFAMYLHLFFFSGVKNGNK